MRGLALVFSLLTGCLLFSCSSSKKAAEEQPIAQFKGRVVKSITVDGNDADWQGLPTATSPLYSFTYSIARDEASLYLLMKIDNPVEQTKFLRGGMELWIDPTDKRSKKTEVIFPVKGELDEGAMRPVNASADPKINAGLIRLNIKAALISLNRVGFKPEYTGVQTISQATGFKGAINWIGEGTLVYELEIPLQAFEKPLPKEAFELGFSIGAVERTTPTNNSEGAGEMNRSGGGMGRGGMRGGGGGRYGGGSYGRGARSGSTERQSGNTDWKKMAEKEAFWVQCSL